MKKFLILFLVSNLSLLAPDFFLSDGSPIRSCRYTPFENFQNKKDIQIFFDFCARKRNIPKDIKFLQDMLQRGNEIRTYSKQLQREKSLNKVNRIGAALLSSYHAFDEMLTKHKNGKVLIPKSAIELAMIDNKKFEKDYYPVIQWFMQLEQKEGFFAIQMMRDLAEYSKEEQRRIMEKRLLEENILIDLKSDAFKNDSSLFDLYASHFMEYRWNPEKRTLEA